MPGRIKEKESEGVRLTFRLWCGWYPNKREKKEKP